MTLTEKASILGTISADDLLELGGEGPRGELIRGVFCETMPTGLEHGEIVVRLALEIAAAVRVEGLGRVTASDTGVRLEHDPDTVRAPDVAYFSFERLPPERRVTGFADVAPDLVAEVVSPNDSLLAVHDKALMWLSHDVRAVWVVHPDDRTVDVYRRGRAKVTLAEEDSLEGHDVLPGFGCTVAALFGSAG